jgi:hypothetical protein
MEEPDMVSSASRTGTAFDFLRFQTSRSDFARVQLTQGFTY